MIWLILLLGCAPAVDEAPEPCPVSDPEVLVCLQEAFLDVAALSRPGQQEAIDAITKACAPKPS